MNLWIFATLHSLMNYTNLIESCQARLPVQYASNIELICKFWLTASHTWIARAKQAPCLLQKKLFCGFPGYKPVPPGWFKIVCWFYVGNTERLTESGFMEKPGIEPATPGLHGEAGNRTCDPWFTRHSAYPLHHGGSFPLVCSISCPCWHWLFRFSVLHSNKTFIRLNIKYKIVLSP